MSAFQDHIVDLFASVYDKEISRNNVNNADIKYAFSKMAEAYKPNSGWLRNRESEKVEYNDAAHRCAYLHKHAMIHTGLVCEVLQSACSVYRIKDTLDQKYLKVCSLGGGPGSDVAALIFVLGDMFRNVQCDVTVIDLSIRWQNVFESVISELRNPIYGRSTMVANGFFKFEYIEADLLGSMRNEVLDTISTADVITMVKFISAAACSKTEAMIQALNGNVRIQLDFERKRTITFENVC